MYLEVKYSSVSLFMLFPQLLSNTSNISRRLKDSNDKYKVIYSRYHQWMDEKMDAGYTDL